MGKRKGGSVSFLTDSPRLNGPPQTPTSFRLPVRPSTIRPHADACKEVVCSGPATVPIHHCSSPQRVPRQYLARKVGQKEVSLENLGITSRCQCNSWQSFHPKVSEERNATASIRCRGQNLVGLSPPLCVDSDHPATRQPLRPALPDAIHGYTRNAALQHWRYPTVIASPSYLFHLKLLPGLSPSPGPDG